MSCVYVYALHTSVEAPVLHKTVRLDNEFNDTMLDVLIIKFVNYSNSSQNATFNSSQIATLRHIHCNFQYRLACTRCPKEATIMSSLL